MVLKIRNQIGITFVEVLVVLALILISLSVVFININPLKSKKKGRDEKRISDLLVLDRAISEYVLDNGFYPGSINTTFSSSILPIGSSGPLLHAGGEGWINEDVSDYVIKLPIDPINNSTYQYFYKHTDSAYELNAVLEYNTDLSSDDNGNDDSVYEIGNSLTIF